MSETNYQELREAAQQASQGEWIAYILPGENGTTYPVHTSEGRHCGFFMVWPGNDGLRNAGANARYIAAIPPKVALSLLDEIKRQEDSNIDAMCRIAELETNIAALVAENAGLKHAMAVTLEHVSVTDAGQAGVAAMIINDALHHSETPATDAFLAEVRAQGVDMARNAMIDFVDGEVGPNKNVPGLIRGAEICVSIAEQLRKGGNQ
ncbi:ead/Ea22-like family protein [Salmonella enterica subsp. enterica serovar Derby]|uniref:Ead/Ea22-like family protein n=1 Tax=Salmonella enterica TaxID=28901 RepID=A0A744T456_SALER|nr:MULTISPECIES: ead/Ea22-like family protein [Enterobacteriaceae]ECA1668934.1 ead/Ea22-like family protein [Salmonella enterica subsp. enterica serovar London]ECM6994160.1 ead/Ea22-like family protein [Salmonella enterica subsp. enterica serovar Typhimurium]MCC1590070.1 ead/Ea22-like family protein [Salmonella enterica subsp. enterica serovar Indiana]HCM2827359.1 ead/Ea22-like family protein [Salmonella enterica subsp. enterica serovar Typhimurium var. monophasic 4,[5],12:i:-]EBV0707501.1 ead